MTNALSLTVLVQSSIISDRQTDKPTYMELQKYSGMKTLALAFRGQGKDGTGWDGGEMGECMGRRYPLIGRSGRTNWVEERV